MCDCTEHITDKYGLVHILKIDANWTPLLTYFQQILIMHFALIKMPNGNVFPNRFNKVGHDISEWGAVLFHVYITFGWIDIFNS